MKRRTVGVVMNGVTGRMGTNQHLVRSILALRADGGLDAGPGGLLWPEPVLVGRDPGKLRRLAERHGLERWTTDLDAALGEAGAEVYFDAQSTALRAPAVRRAVAAGLHVFCEKPLAEDLPTALELAGLARAAGVVNGVVHDKLYLPGLRKLRRLVDEGFFGRILSVRGEFGYWVFPGDGQPSQRPSWNYRAEDGGSIVVDMFCHWRYVLEHLVAPVRSVACLAATHIPQRVDERGERYPATADDAAYATFELEGGVVAAINSSWATRVHRDELVEFQVDGTAGSAVAGLHGCRVQHGAMTPRAVWNPDLPEPTRFRDQWAEVPDNEPFPNAFRAQWEDFLRDVDAGRAHPYDFMEGAKGVQLAELGVQAAHEARRLPVPALTLPEPVRAEVSS